MVRARSFIILVVQEMSSSSTSVDEHEINKLSTSVESNEMEKYKMDLDFNNHNQGLVKLVCSAIFNDNVVRYQDLKDLAWDNGYNEDEIEGIAEVLDYWQCISKDTSIPMFDQDFVVRSENKYKLISQELL